MASDPTGGPAPRPRGEAGAVIVIVAAAMSVLVVLLALVLDLGGARRDRDADQVAADAMALAAAADLGGATASAARACEAAWDYLVVNLPTAETAPAPSCAAFAHPCVAGTPRSIDVAVDEYRITLTHPVPDGHPLLDGRPPGPLDGAPCDRLGVRIRQARANLIATGAVDLDVHAVARFVAGVGGVQAPLILLAEHACGTLSVSGTSALAVHTASGAPGYIAVDSDGADCTNANKVIFDVNGQGTVAADRIAMWALADGDPTSAYSTRLVSPLPVAASAPVGTSAMEWRYNCDPVAGCPGSGPPYIDGLVAARGGPGEPLPVGSFLRWTANGGSCAPSGATVVPAGNWYIDCGTAGLSTNGSLTFQGGNLVSDGPITASGPGGLRVNCADEDPDDLVAPVVCAADPPAPATWVLRTGDLVDNGDLELRETAVHLGAGRLSLSGGRTVTWTAPDDPSHPLDDLLLWTTGTDLVKITGSASLHLEGIIYVPNGSVELAGTTGTVALRAQILARSARLVGGAQLTLAPEEDRMLLVGAGRPVLVR